MSFHLFIGQDGLGGTSGDSGRAARVSRIDEVPYLRFAVREAVNRLLETTVAASLSRMLTQVLGP